MKNILALFILSCVLLIGQGNAQAIYLQQPAEPPYPPTLSPAIDILPHGFVTINVGRETYYYSKGVFYQMVMRDQKYVVVPPPIGAIIFDIPRGYQYMYIDGNSYYVYQGVYYKRVLEGYKVIYPPV